MFSMTLSGHELLFRKYVFVLKVDKKFEKFLQLLRWNVVNFDDLMESECRMIGDLTESECAVRQLILRSIRINEELIFAA